MIDDLEGKVIAGKYRIDSLLTDSGLGPVYRGTDIMTDAPVTVEVLAPALAVDKRLVDRFLSVAKKVSHIGHPHVLPVSDYGTDTRDITYTVYEGEAGALLAELPAEDNLLPVGQALDIARQTAEGLAAAHAEGLVHGGLDPEKILITQTGGLDTARVYGFGSEHIGKGADAVIEYRAPETYDGSKPDGRSDVYSLGVLLYQMLTGVVPFTGRTGAELKEKQFSGPPPALSAFRVDLPSDLEPIILSALAADPEKRYQTMQAFAEDLQMLTIGSPKPAASAAAAPADGPKRNVWQTAFIALAGVAVLAVALIYATSVKRSDPTAAEMQADAGSLPVQPIGPATGAQEDSLAKLPAMTAEEIMAFENSNTALPPGAVLPGGDGLNPWAQGTYPPAGAPLAVGPPGERISGDPNSQSPFMPGLDLVCKDVTTGQVIPCPTFDGKPAAKPSPTPKAPPANANIAVPAQTPKPLAVPPANAVPQPRRTSRTRGTPNP